MQYTDDVVWNSTLETYVTLLTTTKKYTCYILFAVSP